jgi:hypothetical protein
METFGVIIFPHCHHIGILTPARSAPGCPEIYKGIFMSGINLG